VSAEAYLPPEGLTQSSSYTVEVLGESVVVDSPLVGAHQQRNLALAIASAAELKRVSEIAITPSSIAAGIRQTRWPGRLERLTVGGIEWILDVAHNTAGALALRDELLRCQRASRPRTLIFSCLRDKPLRDMAEILFPIFENVIFVTIHSTRATKIEDLISAAKGLGTPAMAADSMSEAFILATENSAGASVVISGSVYLVGEARSQLFAGERK
jgi:dihydrofolate synthase/folylpolyglutamate synthase